MSKEEVSLPDVADPESSGHLASGVRRLLPYMSPAQLFQRFSRGFDVLTTNTSPLDPVYEEAFPVGVFPSHQALKMNM